MKKNIKRIEKLLEELQFLFGVQNYERNITLKKDDEDEAAAEIRFDEKYQRITIIFFPCFWEHTLSEQRKIILHELCHSITIPMNRMAIEFVRGNEAVTETQFYNVMERSTCQIENIIDGLLQNRMRYAKKAYSDYLKK